MSRLTPIDESLMDALRAERARQSGHRIARSIVESVAEQIDRTGKHPIRQGRGRGRRAARWTARSVLMDATSNELATGRHRHIVHGAGYPLTDAEHAMASWTQGVLEQALGMDREDWL